MAFGYWTYAPYSKWRSRKIPWRSILWGSISVAGVFLIAAGAVSLFNQGMSRATILLLAIGAALWALFVYELTAD